MGEKKILSTRQEEDFINEIIPVAIRNGMGMPVMNLNISCGLVTLSLRFTRNAEEKIILRDPDEAF
jgi:hypothetical protein